MSSLLAKRPKIKDTRVIDNSNEHFSGINKIEFYNNLLENQNETLCYRYYNHAEKINGHNIDEWLRFIINYKNVYEKSKVSNTFEKLKSSIAQPWDDRTSTVENYKRRIRAFYELMLKLGMKYWTAAVEDIIPQGETLDEIFHHYEDIADFINDLQQRTGIKLAWLSTDFPFLENDGKLNNPTEQTQMFSLYGQQIKKAMEMAQKLNTDCFLINCPSSSENQNIICVNTNVSNELKNYAKMLKMIADYKDYIGYRGELLIGISNNNKINQNYVEMFPDNQNYYLFDAFSILCFLKQHNLDKQFRIKIQTPREFLMISEYMGNVGAIDLHTTPTIQTCVTIMKTIFDNGLSHTPPGIVINGLSLRSNDYKNMFEDFIANIDTYVASLHVVFKMYSESIITKNVHGYTGSTSFPNSLKECDEQARKTNIIQLFKHISPTNNTSHKRHWDILIERFKNNL